MMKLSPPSIVAAICMYISIMLNGAHAQRGFRFRVWRAAASLASNVGFEQGESICPPAGFDTQPDFDLEEYISAPWYVQKQEPNLYQSEDDLNCVRSVYQPLDGDIKNGLRVYNFANRGKVNSMPTGEPMFFGSQAALIALPEDPESDSITAASKLKVGIKLPGRFGSRAVEASFGPYWVAAAGVLTSKSGYDWAIVVGGEPKFKAGGESLGCRPNSGRSIAGQDVSSYSYQGGLWFFSRKPVDPAAARAMTQIAKEKGLDVSQLVDVRQEGCTYSGAMNKDGSTVP